MARQLGQKTYSHLANLNHVPGHYEISTTSLLYHVKRGFSINTDAKEWQQKFLYESGLSTKNFEKFVDPRKAYYGRYVEQQREKEIYVAKILEQIEVSSCLAQLHPKVFFPLCKTIPIFRYVFQCLQMGASYLGNMAPSSRVLIPFLFQAADETRRIQLMAYMMGLFRRHYAQFGDDARSQWETSSHWQPLRKLLEKMLVTYDFGEALIALNYVIKPKIDFVLVKKLSDLTAQFDAYLINNVFASMEEDLLWHSQWASALMDLIIIENNNRALVDKWATDWSAPVNEAVSLIIEKDFHGGNFSGANNELYA